MCECYGVVKREFDPPLPDLKALKNSIDAQYREWRCGRLAGIHERRRAYERSTAMFHVHQEYREGRSGRIQPIDAAQAAIRRVCASLAGARLELEQLDLASFASLRAFDDHHLSFRRILAWQI